MSQLSTSPSDALAGTAKRRVLVTGAAGRIGSYFAEHAKDRYHLRLMVREEDEVSDALKEAGEIVTAELSDLSALKRYSEGIDTVLHLAANPSPAALWEEVLPDNIVGSYHAFVAAKAAGCRRLVYASSIHAISGYPEGRQVRTSDPVNPGDLYGVSKCFGEALGRYMAEQEGLSCIAVRIGAFQPLEAAKDEDNLSLLNAFVSERDLHHLLEKCIDAEGVRFAIVHGLSDNVFNRMDLSDTKELLGYRPQHDLADENPKLKDLHLSDKLKPHSRSGQDQPSGIREDV